MAFLLKESKPTGFMYGTFSYEILAIYLGIRHLKHILEGCDFMVYIDNKTIRHATTNPNSPRESGRLE